MNPIREQAKSQRKFLPVELNINSWDQVKVFAKHLLNLPIESDTELKLWLRMRSELDAALDEEKAWRYINQSCHTNNKEYAKAFSDYVSSVEEPYALITNQLDQKLLNYCDNKGYPETYEIFIRSIRKQAEIFREENTKIQAGLEVDKQEYGAITGAMTVTYKGKELTLQQAQNLLKSTNREERKKAFELIGKRRIKDSESLHQLLDKLLQKRQQLAQNAGFSTYLEYRFAELGRFDYTLSECEAFHKAAQKHAVPLQELFHQQRQDKLGVPKLQPYDLEVDQDGKEALKPFSNIEELVDKTISCFSEVDSDFGSFIQIMKDNGFLDLDSRKGKAPGGYNYPLLESNVPFIFMNATNNLRDLETMMHEGGHAIHTFLSKDLEFTYYKETPAEIAEVASMAMELISMEHWEHFFTDKDELKRAKLSQLQGVIQVIPWVATVDKYQHWLYTHPNHSHQERTRAWLTIEKELSSRVVDWAGYENFRESLWQKQIHIYQFPLYYIEYGIAQLGAIGIWKNYKTNPQKAIAQYRKALSLGYSVTLPELFQKAGVEFNFSPEYIKELMDFVKMEIDVIVS